MDLILPTNQNTSAPVTLDTKVLVVIGANGAGKSSFGRNLHQRYAGQSVWISGMHSLFLSSEENKAPVNGNELTRLQSMIAERLFIPRMSEYEKLILHLQTEEFEAAVSQRIEILEVLVGRRGHILKHQKRPRRILPDHFLQFLIFGCALCRIRVESGTPVA